jgi:hypothetical protein
MAVLLVTQPTILHLLACISQKQFISVHLSVHLDCNKVWNNWQLEHSSCVYTKILLHILSIPTWFPNTPMAQAVDTWLEPNQTAAKRGGMLSRNTWDNATNVCPVKVTQNLSGATDTALIHEPKAHTRAPSNIAHLKPYNKRGCYL